jgi:hypothetical protein
MDNRRPSSPPLPTGRQASQKGDFPLFGKEGLGEIFTTICLFNYGLVSKDLVSDLAIVVVF